MKRTSLLLAGCLTLLLAGCDKNDGGPGEGPVSRQAQEALAVKYPNAANVVWETRGEYVVAHFSMASSKAAAATAGLSAWFDNGGDWYMTETDIRFEDLPTAVRTAFAAGEYAGREVDEADKLERNGTEIVYVIEVEGDGTETDADLYYSPDGVLIKMVADAEDDYDYEDYIPAKPSPGVESYLREHHADARILEIDSEDGMTEVEILDGRLCRELLFDRNGNWLYTKTETDYDVVPDGVRQALTDSEYGSYRIDDIDHYRNANGDFYRFELESAAGDVKVDIAPDGTLSVVDPDADTVGNGQMLDPKIADFITGKYPGSRINEYGYDDGLLEVEIYHDSRKKDVYFNGSDAWVKTEWDVRDAELPAAVTDAIAASEWATYRIDDIEYVQTSAAEYYRIELESGDSEKELCMDAQGRIV